MPSYDSSRARFRLADRHLAVLGHLSDGRTPPEELFPSLVELQELGLVGAEGELHPALRELTGTLAEPRAVVRIEVTGDHGPVHHGLVVGDNAVIAHDGWPGEEESEYLSILPTTLVWEIARMVNLRGVSVPEPEPARIETTMGALDAALVALGAAQTGGAAPSPADGAVVVRAALAAADTSLADRELDLLADLVCSLDCAWRVTVVWGAPPTPSEEPVTALRALAVWDCGGRGYWVREQPEEPILPGAVVAATPLRLVPVGTSVVWARLTDLLPDRAELAPDAAA
ncbi:hypothetical protein RVR_6998 [Actinacidiphila reveromycinica]|uniref:Uncharacterized protein n=1 Tax=Actinacidiphila reveromycinica TaxID=659352 RepID=A0A7U3UWV3_9ACTN|nr:hypothetical protein [Streptomyces sp. SN-593]BBB00097.1 hypothetical protein RVR_6998 [Streptomyces sp. SN-593]